MGLRLWGLGREPDRVRQGRPLLRRAPARAAAARAARSSRVHETIGEPGGGVPEDQVLLNVPRKRHEEEQAEDAEQIHEVQHAEHHAPNLDAQLHCPTNRDLGAPTAPEEPGRSAEHEQEQEHEQEYQQRNGYRKSTSRRMEA